MNADEKKMVIDMQKHSSAVSSLGFTEAMAVFGRKDNVTDLIGLRGEK